MKSETYTLTPERVHSIKGDALDGKEGYVQGYTDSRGSFIALLIPYPEDEMDNLIDRIKNGY